MGLTTAILCPGQGAQVLGMGRDYHDGSPAARAVFEEAHAALGYDLASLCFQGPEDRLQQTDVSQPAIYVVSVACYRAAIERGLIDPSAITALAGLSLGEYTALHLGGAFSFAQGLALVAARGRYMQEAAVATSSGMVSILGADEAQATALCQASAQGQVLVPANFNCPGQIVVSGAAEACVRVAAAAEASGYRATPLKVAGAFHSPLMASAARQMAAELEKVPMAPLALAVWANVTAEPHADPPAIRRRLVEQIVQPVRWSQTMQAMLQAPPARFVELAPGRVLTGLMKKIDRRFPVVNLGTLPVAA